MLYGILESINTKNRLYKRFIQTDKNNIALFDTLKAEYHIYRARLRRTRECSMLEHSYCTKMV